jgi:mono/diheme cytochrome c family protein
MSRAVVLACFALSFTIAGARAQATANAEVDIRAGHNLAVGNCIACHVVSSGQTIQPVLGSGIPSFQDIANRPSSNTETLQTAMKNARWHEPAMAATLLPMSRLSDNERAQVASYIMSLRNQH